MDTEHQAPPATPAKPVYVVAAHPNWRESRVNRRLLQAALATESTEVCDLYARYPDYSIRVPTEQARLQDAQLIVLLHPVQWYSMPALLKLWVDEVLTHGWAYGGGKALQGKDLWLVATTGGPETSYHPQGYNRYFFDAFLPPYEQSAILCGMRFLPPMVLHGAHRVSTEVVAQHLTTFSQRLQSYPDWPELEELEQYPACAVPMKDRLPRDEASIEADPESKDAGTTTNAGATR